ncbi:hypothetical protein NUU61_003999 [Penicillium alfredii]|uniref:RTA1 domain protein n=1 Tax=Penicillium alfredii TaxID=1506179 RepID=A0A9W9KE76_9EURO|nr:uncharacterized protein NUU61_003999 [Penicillium alfredii]KAJ5101777.1 hypothetical protein NUU61_003999 [Penicillium alfredii]
MPPTTTTTTSPTASPSCLHVSPAKNGYLPPESCDAILYYVPSFGAAILFCVLYGITAVLHLAQAIVYKKAYAWVIIMGAAWELLAFIFRTLQTRHQNSDTWDTLYMIFFLLAPIWINAFIYMTLGRMIYFFLPQKGLAGISAPRYGIFFVTLDIVAFLVQCAGAFLMSNKDIGHSLMMTGLHVYMGGIGLQEFFLLCFWGLAIKLHVDMIGIEKSQEVDPAKFYRGAYPWRWLFYSTYFALTMISIRIFFRLGQYSQGFNASNPVLSHEAYEYVLDATPMFLTLAILNVFHPGRILQGPDSAFPKLSRKEKKFQKEQKKQQKKEEKAQKKALAWSSDKDGSDSEGLDLEDGNMPRLQSV